MHGCKHLEEISAGWICASRTLGILSLLAKKWQVELPEEAAAVLARTDRRNGPFARPSDPMVDPQQQAFLNLTAAAVKAKQDAETSPAVTMSPTQQLAQSSGTYTIPAQQMNIMPNQNQFAADTAPQSSSKDQMTDQTRLYQAYEKDPSPSEMFGGVDQLIRDSQDWIYRESQQVATGFENWDDLSMDPLTWTNGVAPVGTTLDFVPQATQPMQAQSTMPMTTSQIYTGGMAPVNTAPSANVGMNGNMSTGTGYQMMRWLSNADDMATYYNEGAFYQ